MNTLYLVFGILYLLAACLAAVWVQHRRYRIYEFERECIEKIKSNPAYPFHMVLGITEEEYIQKKLEKYIQIRPSTYKLLWSTKKLTIQNWFDEQTQRCLFGIYPLPKVFKKVKRRGTGTRNAHR